MSRSAYPRPGLFDKIFDQDMRPLLAVRQDTVGRHDTFGLACNARGYEERGFPGHLNRFLRASARGPSTVGAFDGLPGPSPRA